jgi:uncharacterized protein (TIGR02466 family)
MKTIREFAVPAAFSSVKVQSTDLEPQFATYLMSRVFTGVEELNAALAKLLLKLEKEERNVASETSNVGGFHTDTQLLSRSEPEIVKLREMIREAVDDYMGPFIQAECTAPPQGVRANLWGWGLNMREGDSNSAHVHPNAKVSGVYYISVPPLTEEQKKSAKPEGAIMFHDPRPRASMNRLPNQISEIVIPPEPGLLIVFPSYHEHSVLPFRGSAVRHCIAFNMNF